MSSTTSGLARTRPLRNPAGGIDNNGKDVNPARASRIASPTRLKPPSSSSAATTTNSTTTTRSTRPLSGISAGLGRAFSSRDKRGGSTAEPTKSATAPSRKISTVTASSASSGTSLARPRTAGGVSSSSINPPVSTRTRAQTHTRTKSQGISLAANATLAPPSSASSAASHHSRPVSVQSSASSGTGPARTTQSHRRQQSASKTAAPSRHLFKPAFSTLQQHYSPVKSHAPKPATASYLAPPSPSKLPANVQASAEISRLQTELLQLHILHRDAQEVDNQWRASAKKNLGEKFASTVKSNSDIGDLERDAVEEGNASALKSWLIYSGDAPTSYGRPRAGSRVSYEVEGKIQALDSVVTGLWTMGETGGKYSRVVRKFERWISRAEDAMKMRSRGRSGTGMLALLEANPGPSMNESGDDGLFVGNIDDTWKEECGTLYRKLDGWRRMLRDIGDLPDVEGMDNSALAKTLAGCREMVYDMLAELDSMERIERDAVAAENEWVRKVNREEGIAQEEKRRAGAIWRSI
ncbi:hypothetical protein MKZ38_002632 [Zalerion maritima]|uniref:Uncharacterized protein n=1 Tax=Zalerion maritima TaxID=339359 RepID=A0AAD5RX49_9PEZI|nr:hypothetical protein MKZ38_002632 [Zalerion maritima]